MSARGGWPLRWYIGCSARHRGRGGEMEPRMAAARRGGMDHDGDMLAGDLSGGWPSPHRGPIQGLSEAGLPEQPKGHQITGVEGKVEKGREVAEGLDWRVLRLVEDPHGQDIASLGQRQDTRLGRSPGAWPPCSEPPVRAPP